MSQRRDDTARQEPLTWGTPAVPTVTGYYWWRFRGETVCDFQWVAVEDIATGLLMTEEDIEYPFLELEWAGPVAGPREPPTPA